MITDLLTDELTQAHLALLLHQLWDEYFEPRPRPLLLPVIDEGLVECANIQRKGTIFVITFDRTTLDLGVGRRWLVDVALHELTHVPSYPERASHGPGFYAECCRLSPLIGLEFLPCEDTVHEWPHNMRPDGFYEGTYFDADRIGSAWLVDVRDAFASVAALEVDP